MKKKRILVLGATGMAGHMIYYYLKEQERYEIHNMVFRTKLTDESIICDVRDKHALRQVFQQVKPDIAINCIGALVKESKTNPDNAIYLNAYLPHFLKSLSEEVGGRLIHISTDCVFSGKKGKYAEDDFRDADDVYGRSKALGEINSEYHLTLRTSIIGPELKAVGEGLFDWFMHQTGSINGYTEAYWGGISTLELAKSIEKSIIDDLHGLIHLSNGAIISKFELLSLFNDFFRDKSIEIKPDNTYSIDKSLLKSTKFEFNIPDYPVMMNELLAWVKDHNYYNYSL